MSIAEIKLEIQNKIEVLNETQLLELQSFINRINSIPVNEWDLKDHVNNIVMERKEILDKLAK